MKLSTNGQNRLKKLEALRLTAYFCIAGRPTISWGVTECVTAEDVRCKRTISLVEAQRLFDKSLGRFERAVETHCSLAPNQNQFDAMVLLAYNIGITAFAGSTVLRAHNRGDTAAAARAFGLFNKATIDGVLQVSKGLVTRRAAEAALYLEPVTADDGVSAPDMPQVVAPERPLTDSKINRSAAAAGVTATIAAASDAFGAVNTLKTQIGTLGDWLLPVLLVAVVGLCGYIVWERLQQRKEGRA